MWKISKFKSSITGNKLLPEPFIDCEELHNSNSTNIVNKKKIFLQTGTVEKLKKNAALKFVILNLLLIPCDHRIMVNLCPLIQILFTALKVLLYDVTGSSSNKNNNAYLRLMFLIAPFFNVRETKWSESIYAAGTVFKYNSKAT